MKLYILYKYIYYSAKTGGAMSSVLTLNIELFYHMRFIISITILVNWVRQILACSNNLCVNAAACSITLIECIICNQFLKGLSHDLVELVCKSKPQCLCGYCTYVYKQMHISVYAGLFKYVKVIDAHISGRASQVGRSFLSFWNTLFTLNFS